MERFNVGNIYLKGWLKVSGLNWSPSSYPTGWEGEYNDIWTTSEPWSQEKLLMDYLHKKGACSNEPRNLLHKKREISLVIT